MRVSILRTASRRESRRPAAVRSAGLECGFEGLLRADHYFRRWATPTGTGPTDAWVTLAGLARETSRIRLGTLVASATSPAARSAGDHRGAGGRDERWPARSRHRRRLVRTGAPVLRHRVSQPRGALQPARRAARHRHRALGDPRGERFTYHGRYYRLDDAPALPKPRQQPHPPIILGGRGQRRTRTWWRFADEYNMPFKSVAEAAMLYKRVAEACDRIGRTRPLVPAGVVVAMWTVTAEAQRRAAPLHEERTAAGGSGDRLAGTGGGSAGEYAALGVSRCTCG
jgi:alkanesulfonate monooxygenase SsuD/methylene tetrahydromethanopterin reductase-like flavin-dependent oxidoreductase (luciferase family)